MVTFDNDSTLEKEREKEQLSLIRIIRGGPWQFVTLVIYCPLSVRYPGRKGKDITLPFAAKRTKHKALKDQSVKGPPTFKTRPMRVVCSF